MLLKLSVSFVTKMVASYKTKYVASTVTKLLLQESSDSCSELLSLSSLPNTANTFINWTVDGKFTNTLKNKFCEWP